MGRPQRSFGLGKGWEEAVGHLESLGTLQRIRKACERLVRRGRGLGHLDLIGKTGRDHAGPESRVTAAAGSRQLLLSSGNLEEGGSGKSWEGGGNNSQLLRTGYKNELDPAV